MASQAHQEGPVRCLPVGRRLARLTLEFVAKRNDDFLVGKHSQWRRVPSISPLRPLEYRATRDKRTHPHLCPVAPQNAVASY
jgi:hypothetical protein